MKKTERARSLTPRQAEALAFIRGHIDQNGHSPNLQEIGDALKVTKTSAFEHVRELERKGWITRDAYSGRSIRLVERCPRCGRGGAPAIAVPDDKEIMRLADNGGKAEVCDVGE